MAAPSSHMWYVRAAGGVWGPYPEARLHAFIAEGRVTAQTLLSPWNQGPFAPAASTTEFAELVAGGSSHPSPPEPDRPVASSPAAAARQPPSTVARAADTGPTRPVLIWARVSEAAVLDFHAELAALGAGMTLQPGLWLVQARAGAAVLRNRLSRRLGPADSLLVVEAPLAQAAWFNLDPSRDRELRRLWTTAGAA